MRLPGTVLFATLALLLGHGSPSARAATNSAALRLTLADVLQLAAKGSPRLAVAREEVAAARAERHIAGAYPNPTVSVDHQQPANGERTIFNGDYQQQFSFEFPVLWPAVRSARIARADADLAAAAARAAGETNSLTGDALASFLRLLARQETSAVLANDLTEVARIKALVAGRREQGAASEYDVTRVEVELGVLANEVEKARAETAAEAGQLAALLALTNGLPVAEGPLQPLAVATNLLHRYEADPFNSPQVIAAARQAAAAEKGITTAERERWPQLSVTGGRTWTRRPYGAANIFGLSVEIPVFDTRQGQVDKAKAEARAAEARRLVVVGEVASALRQLSQSVQRHQAALERHRTEIEPRLARLQQMSADAYTLGRSTLLELLDAQQARREVRLQRIEITATLAESQIRFLTVTGELRSHLEPKP